MVDRANGRLERASKLDEELKTSFAERFAAETSEVDRLYREIQGKQKASEIAPLITQLKQALDKLRVSASEARSKIVEARSEVELARRDYRRATRLGLSGWRQDYVNLLAQASNWMVRSLETSESFVTVLEEFISTFTQYTEQLGVMVEKAEKGEFENSTEVDQWEATYLNPLVEKLGEQTKRLTVLQRKSNDEIKKANALTEKAKDIYQRNK